MNTKMTQNNSDKNNEIKVVLTKSQINNIMIFLDRVRYNGFKEINAVQEIMSALQSEIKNEQMSQPHSKNIPDRQNYPENL